LYSNSSGTSWLSSTLPSLSAWTNLSYGKGTFVAISSGAAYYDLATTAVTGTGTGAKATVRRYGTQYKVVITTPGNGYNNGDQLSIAGTSLGGTSPANDLTITVASLFGLGVGAVTVLR
jgi:hypothetical protein